MKRNGFHIGLAIALVLGLVLLSPAASAGSHRPNVLKALGAVSHGGHHANLRLPALKGQNFRAPRNNVGAALRHGLGGSGISRHGGSIASAIGNGGLANLIQGYGNGHGNWRGNGAADVLAGIGRHGYGGYGYHERDSYDYPEAMRDVGIANAVVNLAGVMATAGQRYPYAVAPYAVAPYPMAPVAVVPVAPAPVVAVPVAPAPVAHYERERVVIQGPHYESYQVLIPEIIDPRTGQKSGGFYETHTRLIPEVTETRDVLVGPAE